MSAKAIQNQEEEEYEEEDFSYRRDGPSSSNHHNNNDTDSYKDGKNTDKACAMRSKHSVTEQRRRSKINERFQMLRDLIPHSDQKRDTASFLLEVIEYVQYLQEKVLKFEGPYQGCRSEPTKLMPWRNSHWRSQNFVGQPQTLKIGSGPLSTFPGKFDENNVTITTPNTLTSGPAESDDMSCRGMEQQSELSNQVLPFSAGLKKSSLASGCNDGAVVHPFWPPSSDAQSVNFPPVGDAVNNNQHEELTIESGTICISSVYSQGLLNNLTQALQSGGADLSRANISVQIDLGKRANKLISGTDATKVYNVNMADQSILLRNVMKLTTLIPSQSYEGRKCWRGHRSVAEAAQGIELVAKSSLSLGFCFLLSPVFLCFYLLVLYSFPSRVYVESCKIRFNLFRSCVSLPLET